MIVIELCCRERVDIGGAVTDLASLANEYTSAGIKSAILAFVGLLWRDELSVWEIQARAISA